MNIHFDLEPIEGYVAEPKTQPIQPRPEAAVASVTDEMTKATITRRATLYPRPSMAYVMLGIISSNTIISVKEETEKWVRFSSDGYEDAWVLKSYTDRAERYHFRRGRAR